jgi:hypothetical protein
MAGLSETSTPAEIVAQQMAAATPASSVAQVAQQVKI